ncbi:MAG: hypothetical protein U0869_03230 [Chloroflexota bacterium]
MLFGAMAVPVMGHDDDDVDPGPYYTAVVNPSNVAAGTSTGVSITVTRILGGGEHKPDIRSVKVTPPSGFVVNGSTDPIVIAGLDLDTLGEQTVVSLPTSVACGQAGDRTWTVNAYTGRGRELAQKVSGSQLTQGILRCSLDVVRQPALAGENTTITSVAADPNGDTIAVRLLDGTGAPEQVASVGISISITSGTGASGATLSGNISDLTNANGVAAFTPKIDKPAHDYRFDATAGPGIIGTTTAAFDITGVAVRCSGACSGSDQSGNTQATVQASTAGLLTLTVGIDGVNCNDAANRFYSTTSQPILFNVTGGTGRTTVTIGLAAASVDRSYKKYQVCFSSPLSAFTNRFGVAIAAGDAGLLPDCRRKGDPDSKRLDDESGDDDRRPIATPQGPCVEKRSKDAAGNVLVKFSVPAGDPRGAV